MTDEQAQIIAQAIRDGFNDLGNRIAQGTNPENVAMSLKFMSESIDNLVAEIPDLRDAINTLGEDNTK